ncbi:MAG: hypothetical protein CMJ19_20775 [Phycisphaeraceae bacterium]|nr:hypothetical protein [Phycisphaeraceae bacterium]
MGLLGKESSRDVARADAFKVWISARPGHAIISLCSGVVAVLDAFTLVIGIAAGLLAIIAGLQGLGRIQSQPQLLGKRLCIAGMVLGSLGIVLSLVLWFVVYPMLSQQ